MAILTIPYKTLTRLSPDSQTSKHPIRQIQMSGLVPQVCRSAYPSQVTPTVFMTARRAFSPICAKPRLLRKSKAQVSETFIQ